MDLYPERRTPVDHSGRRVKIDAVLCFCTTLNMVGLLSQYGYAYIYNKLNYNLQLPKPLDIYDV